jgi:hypothetical protein
MAKSTFLIFFCTPLLSCSQPVSIDKSHLKQIYSDLINADSLKQEYYLIDSIQNFSTKSIRQSNVTFFIADCDIVHKGVWTNELFDNTRIISRKYLDSLSKPDPFAMTPSHYSFSLPYFSKDKRSFIIYYNFYCGSLCAEYSLRLYKRVNGKWRFIKSFFMVVS